jgi:hypothetical protein
MLVPEYTTKFKKDLKECKKEIATRTAQGYYQTAL